MSDDVLTEASSGLGTSSSDGLSPSSADWTAQRYFWTPERERQLRTMLKHNRMSRIEMGRALGVSKNSICGKTKRMGLSVPRPDVDPETVRGRRIVRRREQARARALARKLVPKPLPPRPLWKPLAMAVKPPADAPTPRPVSIIDLTPTTCRWPLWSDQGWAPAKMYCGDTVAPGSVYCGLHLKMKHRPKGER